MYTHMHTEKVERKCSSLIWTPIRRQGRILISSHIKLTQQGMLVIQAKAQRNCLETSYPVPISVPWKVVRLYYTENRVGENVIAHLHMLIEMPHVSIFLKNPRARIVELVFLDLTPPAHR